jgi:hypothetical protein
MISRIGTSMFEVSLKQNLKFFPVRLAPEHISDTLSHDP